MSLTLPSITEGRRLDVPYFPTVFQCFIFRMWGMIPVDTLARTLRCTADETLSAADEMGLPNTEVCHDWLKKGYITIIRSLWHIAPYEQICEILGWDADKLAFILKEDDFLSIKLGGFKPDTPSVRYHQLTAAEKSATAILKQSAASFYSRLAPQSAVPFGFSELFSSAREKYSSVPMIQNPRFDTRIVYSYCALYGDTFTENTDYSFPDELLEAYSRLGVNGIWCQAVLYTLAPYSFMPELSEGYEHRLAGLILLTERMAKYGIKMYLYINEPRALPNSFFDTHENLRGQPHGDFTSLCTSTPEVQNYLRTTAAFLAERVPNLGGFITITASENFTSCYSHSSAPSCPRCSQRKRYEVTSEINSLLYEGAHSVNPEIKLLAWTWGWNETEIGDAIDALADGIGVMSVSERLCEKTVGGIKTDVNDYSISVVGPGEYSKQVWKLAADSSHRAYAKVQLNNTWECASVPFLPVFETVYRHICNLIESGVGGLMLDWTLGGYPSPTLAIASRMYEKADKIPTLESLYREVFPVEAIAEISAAVHLFSMAFNEYPFHIGNLYTAPQNVGPSNPLYFEKTGFSATMVCYPYDDISSWRAVYPEAVFEEQCRKLSSIWAQGITVLDKIPQELYEKYSILRELYDSAEGAYCHFASVYNQICFVRARDCEKTKTMAEVSVRESELALRLANIVRRNPTIGFESSNHYFYNIQTLCEKYINCAFIKGKIR